MIYEAFEGGKKLYILVDCKGRIKDVLRGTIADFLHDSVVLL